MQHQRFRRRGAQSLLVLVGVATIATHAVPRGAAAERVIRPSVVVGPAINTGGAGVLHPDIVLRSVRMQLGGISSCYERARRHEPQLAGRVVVQFTIPPNGRPSAVTATGLNEAAEVDGCVAAVFRRTVFPSPEGGAADFSVAIQFAPGG